MKRAAFVVSQTLESNDMYSLEPVEPLFHHMFAQSCLCVVQPAYGHGVHWKEKPILCLEAIHFWLGLLDRRHRKTVPYVIRNKKSRKWITWDWEIQTSRGEWCLISLSQKISSDRHESTTKETPGIVTDDSATFVAKITCTTQQICWACYKWKQAY